MGIEAPFTLRPPNAGGHIGATLAARVIYPAVLAVWTFLGISTWSNCAAIIAPLIFVNSIAGSFLLKINPELKI